jgi:hypothetical protein
VLNYACQQRISQETNVAKERIVDDITKRIGNQVKGSLPRHMKMCVFTELMGMPAEVLSRGLT